MRNSDLIKFKSKLPKVIINKLWPNVFKSNYELIDSGKSVNDSFILGCKFWKTHYDYVWITDYNIKENRSLKEYRVLYFHFNKDGFINYIKVTYEFMEYATKETITACIDTFHNRSLILIKTKKSKYSSLTKE